MENIQNQARIQGAKYIKDTKYILQDCRLSISIVNNIITAIEKSLSPTLLIRYNPVIHFIRNIVKDSIPKITTNLCIELNDATNEPISLFCFSSGLSEHILIPDLYAMTNYDNRLSFKDNISYENKYKKAIFIGSSTGSSTVELNERLHMCNKYRNDSTIHCFINNLCQVSEESTKEIYPNYNDFITTSMTIENQCKYRYIINIDGNTTAWDRVPWILNSNSVLLMKNSKNKCWYTDFLIPNIHYIPFDNDTDLEAIVSSDEDRTDIIRNANQFVKDYLTHDKHIFYMKCLLQSISDIPSSHTMGSKHIKHLLFV
jgi:hypothetical protein